MVRAMKALSAITVALSVFPFLSCDAASDKVPTFAEDIAPVVFSKCAGCHREGQAAPFTLLTYEQVKKRAKQIAEVTGEHVMPPWHADRGVIEYANDRSLSDAQIALIKRWVDGGAPQGDASKTPPLPKFPTGWELGEPSFVVEMPEAFTVPAEGKDIYRNFVIPLNRDEDTWINGIEYKPGAPSAVHHVLYFLDTEGKARQRDAADPLPGYNGMGRSNGSFRYLGGWDLGTQPSKVGYDLAWLVPKGADLVIQVHYHPSGKEVQDKAKLGFHIAKQPTARPWSIAPVPPFSGSFPGFIFRRGRRNISRKARWSCPSMSKPSR